VAAAPGLRHGGRPRPRRALRARPTRDGPTRDGPTRDGPTSEPPGRTDPETAAVPGRPAGPSPGRFPPRRRRERHPGRRARPGPVGRVDRAVFRRHGRGDAVRTRPPRRRSTSPGPPRPSARPVSGCRPPGRRRRARRAGRRYRHPGRAVPRPAGTARGPHAVAGTVPETRPPPYGTGRGLRPATAAVITRGTVDGRGRDAPDRGPGRAGGSPLFRGVARGPGGRYVRKWSLRPVDFPLIRGSRTCVQPSGAPGCPQTCGHEG
jgi:hypothetical protein